MATSMMTVTIWTMMMMTTILDSTRQKLSRSILPAFHPAPNQTHCSPNALFGTNTDADGHADMYQYTGKVGFSNIFIGPRFSSNQLVRRSVCRSRHHQQLNTVEANWAMQCNASELQSYHGDHNSNQQDDDGYDSDHDGDVEGWRMGPRSVRGWIKGSTPLWSLLQHTQSRHNTATTHTFFHKSATSMPVFLCSFVLIVN